MDTFNQFLTSPEPSQQRYVDTLSPHDASALANTCTASAEFVALDLAQRVRVLAHLLAQASPRDYLESEQDRDLRADITPAALARLRAETYDNQIRPLLLDTPADQLTFVLSLKRADRAALLKLLDRYAREYGRSARCRDFETLIGEHP